MLIGNLGQDAEHRFTTNNTAVTSFSIATTSGYKGKDGNWVNETTWHNVVAFALSDYYKDALKKGKKIYVEGRISKRDYTDKDGIKKYITEVIAERNGIIPLEGRDSGQEKYSNSESEPGGGGQSADTQNPDDDLPF